MKTMAGGKAAGIARWAWGDPAGRVQQALDEVRELARAATDPAELAEIQDSGTMLSRLADSVVPQPAAALTADQSIFAQLTAGTIVTEALELAGMHDAWRHERRGPHGEWIRGIGAPPGPRFIGEHEGERARQERIRQLARARQERLIKAEVARQHAAQATTTAPSPVQPGNKAEGIAARAQAAAALSPDDVVKALQAMPLLPGETKEQHMQALPGESTRENVLHERVIHTELAPILEAHAVRVLDKAKAHIEKKLKEADALDDAKSKHDARLKAATEGSIAVAGGILAYIETKIGVPDLIAIASSIGPILIQIIIEFWKRL